MEHGGTHVPHLPGRHSERHERRNTFHGVEINLLQTLLIPTRNVHRPPFSRRTLRRLKRRQLDDFAGFWIHHRLIPRSTHTVRSNCNRRHIDHLLWCSGISPHLFD